MTRQKDQLLGEKRLKNENQNNLESMGKLTQNGLVS